MHDASVRESALRRKGKWKGVTGAGYSGKHALQTKRSGPSLWFPLDNTSKVKVLASRCKKCGKLAVEVGGHRRAVIDLSNTRRRKSQVAVFGAKWPKGRAARLRLVSLGGGQVRIDGVAIWRTG